MKNSTILIEFEKCMRDIFGDDLREVILYGSYARNEQNANSDIDIMILVDTPMEDIGAYYDKVADCAFDFFIKYDVDISPIIKNMDHFNYWKDDLPFYRSVATEGIAVHGL